MSLEKNVRRLASVPLLFEPGKSWNYSLGIDVIGAVIERADDAPLDDVVSQRVTDPLGMSDTAFYCREPSRLALPYVNDQPEPVPMSDPAIVTLLPGTAIRYSPSRALNPHAFPSGGCGMVGTAEDFIRFLEAVRKGGAPILERRSVQTMMSNQIGELTTLLGPGTGFRHRRRASHRSPGGADASVRRNAHLGRCVRPQLVHRSAAAPVGRVAFQHRAGGHERRLPRSVA